MCKNNIQGKKEIDEQEFPDYEHRIKTPRVRTTRTS